MGAIAFLVLSLGFIQAPALSAQVNITPNIPQYGFQVLAGSTRQINVNITGGTQYTVNWSVASTTGGASATFTTPNGADVSSVSGALATVQVNFGSTQGNCSIVGSGSSYSVSSTASVTVQAQSTDDPTKTAKFLFNVCANSPATLANGTTSVIVAPAYQQAYKNQQMTLQSWVMGCSDESGRWSIVGQPSGGNGTLSDTTYRDTLFSASVTGRYTIQYSANCNSGSTTAIVYVSPNSMPSYLTTPNGTRPHECYADPELSGADYEVGPGKAYGTISSTPALTGFQPGTIMRIWNTDTTGSSPTIYHEYYNVQNSGTPSQPIIICGVADSAGNLPILDGTNATAQADVNINADDGLIILHPAHTPWGFWQGGALGPNYVSVTGLHLRNAKSSLQRYSPGSGSLQAWSNFSSCVNFRSGSYVDVSGNELENCSNGIFSAENDANSWGSITQNLTFIGNHVLMAGDPGYAQHTHQAYLQTFYTLAEGNLMDNPSKDVGGQFKFRGVEGIFRYNYLGDGTYRLFDLVEDQDGPDYIEFEQYLGDNQWQAGDTAGANVIAGYQESFQKDFIYGNEMHGTSSEAAVHYAGDQGLPGLNNRNGILYFYYNTLDDAQIVFDNGFAGNGMNPYYQPRFDARNNILWGRTLAWTGLVHMEFAEFSQVIMDATTNLMRAGTFSLATPILGDAWNAGTQTGWPNSCDNTCLWPLAIPINTHIYGLTNANFLSTSTQPYDGTSFVPPAGSSAIGAGTAITSGPLTYMPVRFQFQVSSGSLIPRRDLLTIGAADAGSGGTPTAAAPVFSPGSGTYSSTQSVSISSSTPGATIHYTTDGSTPTATSQSYSGPITVSSTETISAIAVASGYNNSSVSSGTFTITLGQVATPTFSPAPGTYSSTQQVSISTTTGGATIYYTTNGATPTTSSTVFAGPITVSATETIKALAVVSGYSDSAVATATYTISAGQAAAPTFTPAAGTYTSAQNVAISTTTPSATIYFTTNGSTPTTSSTVYSGPISVSSSQTIKALAVAAGFTNSAVASAAYTINAGGPISQAATPTFTPAAGTYTSAQNVAISTTTPSATIYYTTNGSTPTTSSTVYSGPISVSSSQTIEALAVATGFTNSAVASAAYTINISAPVSPAATPTFSPGAGSYTSTQQVSISSTTPGTTIYYTTNGSTPTTSSTVYSGPISVSSSQTIMAIATANGFSTSAIASAAFTITLPANPDFSVTASPTALSVSTGGNATTSVSVVPQNGFNSAVSLSCSGLPTGATCSFTSPTVTPSGVAATTVLTISKSALAALGQKPGPFLPGTTLAAAFCFIGWKKRRRLQMLVLLLASAAGVCLMNGCGGASFITNSTNAAVVSTVTVTATSGALQHSTTVQVSIH